MYNKQIIECKDILTEKHPVLIQLYTGCFPCFTYLLSSALVLIFNQPR
jgi:hypothetical protein